MGGDHIPGLHEILRKAQMRCPRCDSTNVGLCEVEEKQRLYYCYHCEKHFIKTLKARHR